MGENTLTWRLEGGYSRFLEGSSIDLRLQEGPLRQLLNVSPVGLLKRSQPVEFAFRISKAFWGSGPGKLHWRIHPESLIRGLILFSGNPFLGNFRVPRNHFAVQWDIEASAEGIVGKQASVFFAGIQSSARLHHSWVEIFPEELSLAGGLEQAWKGYRNPLDPADIYQLTDSQLVLWSWNGQLQLGVDLEWGLGAGWTIPGTIPWAELQKDVSLTAGFGTRFDILEEGRFAVRMLRRNGKIHFSLRRIREHSRRASFSVGVKLAKPIRIEHLGPSQPALLRKLADSLGEPVVKQVNEVLEESLRRRFEIALTVESARWRRKAEILQATWSNSSLGSFLTSYAALLQGNIPQAGDGLIVRGRFDQIRGKRLSVGFNLLNWIEVKKSTARRTEHSLMLSPTGEVVLEEAEIFEKSHSRWDEIQFLHLIQRETTRQAQRTQDFVWSYGREDKFTFEELQQVLTVALHCGIVPEFALPPRSRFPLRARLLFVTRFSPEGLERARAADHSQKWTMLVRALETADPQRYRAKTFWRDWIDHSELRENIDQDPVQSHLVTRYPVPGRNDFERLQVVNAYRKAKRFLDLLECWSNDELDKIFKAFQLGLDIPIFVFFHLFCPRPLRTSAGLMTGDFEQVWGDESLLTS